MTKRVTEAVIPKRTRLDASTPITVAFVVYRFDVGGLERCVANLCNHLDRERFRPIVVCLEQSGSAAQWLERDDVEIVELGKRPRNDLGVVRQMARTLRERGVDVVHSHNWGTLVEATLARRWAGVPIHVHAERGTVLGSVHGAGFRYRLRARAMRWALRRCDAVVSNAVSTAARIESACGFPATQVRLIPNGVAAPAVCDSNAARIEIRQQLGIAADACVIGSIGRMVPVKNFAMAIDALAGAELSSCDAHLILVGDGPEHDTLQQRAIERNVSDHVHLVGRRDDVGNWLAAMDVYINTSLSEGMSQSIVEAMAAGLPLVVTDVGDSRALVEGADACGLTVDSEDVTALARAVDELMRDGRRCDRLRRNAHRRYREHHGLARMVEDHESCYTRLWEETPTRARGNPGRRAAESSSRPEVLIGAGGSSRGGAVPE